MRTINTQDKCTRTVVMNKNSNGLKELYITESDRFEIIEIILYVAVVKRLLSIHIKLLFSCSV